MRTRRTATRSSSTEGRDDPLPQPECGLLTLAEQDDYTTSLVYEYANTEPLVDAMDEIVAGLKTRLQGGGQPGDGRQGRVLSRGEG